MTGGPPTGPASAYPTFSRPALTCFSGANELFAPPEGASAAPARGKSTAAMVMAVAARMRRRLWLMVSVMDVSPCKVRPIAHLFLGLDRRERVYDLIRGDDGAGVAREIDIEGGLHLPVRVIRGRVPDHRDLVTKLDGIADRCLDAGVRDESHDNELVNPVLLELQIQIRVGETAGTPMLEGHDIARSRLELRADFAAPRAVFERL